MPLRAEDLPPDARRRLQEAVQAPQRRRTTQRAAGTLEEPLGPGPRYRCQCGQEFERWGAKIERHADETGHSRLEAILR